MTVFDRFRAPLDAAEAARRRRAGLNCREEALLLRWGYPFVMDAFRFHLTLTSRLDEAGLAQERAFAEAMLNGVAAPLFVDAVTVMVEPAAGAPFRVLRRCAFALPAGSSPAAPGV